MKKILIFPYNGNALEAIDCTSDYDEILGFVDDDPKKHGLQANGYKVFSKEAFDKYKQAQVLAVPGNASNFHNRAKLIDNLCMSTKRFVTLIHKRANVSKFAKIGYNVLIMAGVTITSNAKIGNHVCILPNTVIHHDVVIEEYCLIGSNVLVAGNTIIRHNCYIGGGSNLINNIEIGGKTLVGLGTNVIGSLYSGSKVVGNPMRQI